MKIVMKGGGPKWDGRVWKADGIPGSITYRYSELEAELLNEMGVKWTGEDIGHIKQLSYYLADDIGQYAEITEGFNKSLAELVILDSSPPKIKKYLSLIKESLRLRTEDQVRIWNKYKQQISNLEKNMAEDPHKDYTNELIQMRREKNKIEAGFKGHKRFFEKMYTLADYLNLNYELLKDEARIIFRELNGLTRWNNNLNNEILDVLAENFGKMRLNGGKMKQKKHSKKGNVKNRMSKKRRSYYKK